MPAGYWSIISSFQILRKVPRSTLIYPYERLRGFDIDCGKSLKLIDGLNPNKYHGHYGISIYVYIYIYVYVEVV